MKTRSTLVVAGIAGIVACASSTEGAVISYPDVTTTNLIYTDISENTSALPPAAVGPLFGAPVGAGDALVFNPVNFSLSGGNGTDSVLDSKLSIGRVETRFSGLDIGDDLTFIEAGGWAVGGDTGDAIASVSLIMAPLVISEVNDLAVGGGAILVNPTIVFSSFTSVGSAGVSVNATSASFSSLGGVSTGGWSAVATYDLEAALVAAGFSANDRVTEVTQVALDNQLVINTTPLDANNPTNFALIDKKTVILSGGEVIPEPATALLGTLGVTMLVLRRRRA